MVFYFIVAFIQADELIFSIKKETAIVSKEE